MKTITLLLSAVLALLIFTACSDAESTVSSEPETEPILEEDISTAETIPSDTPESESSEEDADVNLTLSEVQSVDIYGEPFSGDVFYENELTLVNVWATWCPPCVAEMPELAELEKELREEGIGVVGIVTDTIKNDGTIDEDALGSALTISAQSGVEFDIVFPDEILFNEFLSSVQAFPTSFLVDSNGNILENVYTGAKDKDGWAQVIEDNLDA